MASSEPVAEILAAVAPQSNVVVSLDADQAPSRNEAAAEPKPYLVIRPLSRWAAIDVGELWRYRDLLLTLAIRDVKLRYKQTALGVIWVILQPLLAAGIFSFVFGAVAKLPSDGLPYFVFSYAGLLAWNAFNSTLSKSSASLLDNKNLISKVYFPRLILPLSTVLSTLIDFTVALSVMIGMLLVFRINPGWPIVLLPVWVGLMILLAVGIGLYASALMVEYRDLQYVIPVLLQFLLYGSPVAYALSAVPVALRPYFVVNPLSGLLEAVRWSLLGAAPPSWHWVAAGAAGAAAVFLASAYAFKRIERRFADVI